MQLYQVGGRSLALQSPVQARARSPPARQMPDSAQTAASTMAQMSKTACHQPPATNAQKRSRSSRRAIPGRPGDLNLSRNARSDRRLPAIATFLPVVLRRPVDSALAALVAVMDDAVRPSLADRHFQRIQHQLGAQMIGHRPADDLAAPGIQHDGEVQKAACRRYEG